MKYVKQHFVTGMKVSLPDVLNRMEDGIAAACGAAVEGIGSVTTGDTPAAGIRDGKLCLTLPRGEPGPQGDPGEGLSDNAKALLLSLLAGMLGLALSYGATFLLNGFLFGNSANAYLNGDTSLTPGMLLSPWAFLSAFGFCLLMNLLSAGIPAWRASRMNIVDAINQRGE